MGTKTTIEIATDKGKRTVEAEMFGELAVHRDGSIELPSLARDPDDEYTIPRVLCGTISHRRTGYAVTYRLSWGFTLRLTPLLADLDCWNFDRVQDCPCIDVMGPKIRAAVEVLYDQLERSDDPDERRIARTQKHLWAATRSIGTLWNTKSLRALERQAQRFHGELEIGRDDVRRRYPYEPRQLISDGKGHIIERDLAPLEFIKAEARRAAENWREDPEYADRTAKEAELFEAWVIKERAEGRPESRCAFGQFVVEAGLWEPFDR